MSIVRLIVKQEMVLNLIYLFPECKEKCNFSNNSSNVLYYGTLHLVNFKPIWTWFVKNGTFARHAQSLNSILPKEPVTQTYS